MFTPQALVSSVDPRLNLPVLFFVVGATLFAGAQCGSAQAWQAARTSVNETLKRAGRSAIGHGRRRLQHALVVFEFALAVTLLAGAGLMILGDARIFRALGIARAGGLVVGLAGAYALGRAMQAMLFGTGALNYLWCSLPVSFFWALLSWRAMCQLAAPAP
jgi:hypothetical protein